MPVPGAPPAAGLLGTAGRRVRTGAAVAAVVCNRAVVESRAASTTGEA